MKLPLTVRSVLLWLSCLGLLLPESAVAAAAKPATGGQTGHAYRIGDAALGPDGMLRGRVVDPQGMPVSGARVAVLTQNRSVAEGTADAEGRFAVANLRQGIYLIVGGQGAMAYRVWPAAAAPPSATSDAVVVSNIALVRGQGGPYLWISEHYLLTSAIIATAIAVPIAVIAHNQDDDPASP